MNRLGAGFAAISMAAAVLALAGLNRAPLLDDPAEARGARVALDMARSGDIVLARLDGTPQLAEPPLTRWLQATCLRALGATPLAARLPGALATLGSIGLVLWVSRRRFGDEGALWSTAIYATTPLVVWGARVATADAVFAMQIAGVLALELAAPEDSGARHGVAIGALLGLALLARGPIGVALPAIVVLAGRTASGQDLVPRARTLAAGAVAFLVVTLPWGLALSERVGISGVRDALAGAAFPGIASAAARPAWWHGGVLLAAFAPWSAPLAVGLGRTILRARDPEARTALYAASGLLAGLLVLSIHPAKRAEDLLALAPFAAIVVTWELGQQLGRPGRRHTGSSLLALALVSCAVALAGFAFLARTAAGAWATGAIAAAVSGAALISLVGVTLGRPRVVFGAAAAGAVVTLVTATWLVPGALVAIRSSAPLLRVVPELAGPRPVVFASEGLDALAFALDRPVERIGERDVPERLARADGARIVLPLEIATAAREVGRYGRWKVVEAPADEWRK